MFKRKISLMMVLMMVLTLMIPNFALGATNDYSNHWAEESIQEWFDNGQLSGYEDGSFKPDQTITRAEFMTMVNKAFEFTAKNDIRFKDVEASDWYYQEVQKAVAEGYIIGYEDNTARPGNKISRQEAALIISRIKELTESPSSAKTFNDYSTIASWSVGGVGAVAKEKIMIGYEDDTFRPDRFISRAEALVTIDRSLEVVPVVETPGTGGSTGGGGGGGGGGGSTTRAAILSTLTLADSTTESAIINITTPSAIDSFTTTSSAITITAITADGATMVITVTTPSGIATTATAIDGKVNVLLDTVGEYTINIIVSNKDTSKIDYIDTIYTFVITRE